MVLIVLCLGVYFFVLLAPYVCYHILVKFRYSTVSVMFISLTLTNVESRMSRDFFAWNLRGFSVDFA